MANSIVFATDRPAATLSRLVQHGKLVRIAPGIYTHEVNDVTRVVDREWQTIVGHLMPNAVISDRSAASGGPVNGVLYLVRPVEARIVQLPGLMVLAREGPGPLEGDIELPGGLYLASRWRALAENTRPARAVRNRPPRAFTDDELADWVDRLLRIDGEDRLRNYRDRAEAMARSLDVSPAGIDRLGQMIGAAIGTRTIRTGSQALAARQRGFPYDSDRIERFDRLALALRRSLPQNHPADPNDLRLSCLPFFEAYFSNYIEGTEFELDEAADLVYKGKVPGGRTQDGHDLTGTYQIVNDLVEMSSVATSGEQFVELLRYRHSIILAGRPEKNPGQLKTINNRAGDSVFVRPDLVEGTLRAGFDRLAELDTAWERSVYTMFLVSEVHPFDDGNGRAARVMMNAELVAGNQTRIIIPIVFRDDYLGGLRQLTRYDDPSVLIKALRFAHDYTASIDFTDLTTATMQLERTNAFNAPDSMKRLVLLTRSQISDTSFGKLASGHPESPEVQQRRFRI